MALTYKTQVVWVLGWTAWQGTWVIGFMLFLLAGINELVLPLWQSFVAQGQSQVGLRPVEFNSIKNPITKLTIKLIHPTEKFTHWRGLSSV